MHPDLYADYFQTKYSVDVRHRPFDTNQKWSERIRRGLTAVGKSTGTGESWPESNEYEAKRAIADLIVKNPSMAVHPAHESLLKALVSTLENRLGTLST